MNKNFFKAVLLLDKGEYDSGEEILKCEISECNNQIELIEMKASYAELLCEPERYDEALECANYIIDNAQFALENDCTNELETAEEIKNAIENSVAF